MRLPVRKIVVSLAMLLLAPLVPVPGSGGPVAPADAAQTYGSTPLDFVFYWANKEKACGLSTHELAALMLAPTYPETGAPRGTSPAPMTLSRSDGQTALHSFGSRTSYRNAFWHPGVGPWQFDSAGLGAPYGAHSRIDTSLSAAYAADEMADRYCRSTSTGSSRRSYVWRPWYGCGGGRCEAIFHEIFNGSRLTGVNRQSGISRGGGMKETTCTGPGHRGPFTCWRVDPKKAQGYGGFAVPAFGPTPITAPFYVYTASGYEYRHWLRADTGYDIGVWASRPIGGNARSSLRWHRGQPLVDQGTVPPKTEPKPGPGGFVDVSEGDWFVDGLLWAVEREVMTGYPDQKFHPEIALNRAQALMAIWRAQGKPASTAEHRFRDVPNSAWYDDALDWAVEKNMVEGYPDRTFRGDVRLSRAQYVMMMWRLAERPAPTSQVSFKDARAPSWFTVGMTWAVERGYMTGYPDGTFRPGDAMSRAQAVMTFWRARQFDDVAPSAWYAPALDWGRFRGVVDGYEDHTYRPLNPVDRAETASILFRAMDEPGGAPAHGFSDVASNAWFSHSLDWAADAGIVTGYPDGTYKGDLSVSRAQYLMMLWRIAGSPRVDANHGRTDVRPGSWFEPALEWAAGNRLLAGAVGPVFDGKSPANRALVVALLGNLARTPSAWSSTVTPPSTVVR